MNKQQKAYLEAREKHCRLRDIFSEMEAVFIKDKKIKNSDGEVPNALYCIEDEEVFENACDEFEKKYKAECDEITVAKQILKQTEDELIKFGLSFVPKNIEEILTKDAKTSYINRAKIIDLAMKLDTKTI